MSDFFIGQIFENDYPPEAADFCNNSQGSENACHINEIKPENGIRRFQIVPNDQPDPKEEAMSKINGLQFYLSSTDWYVSRSVETGTPIPADVRVKRMAAREKISQLREQLKD